MTSLKCKMLITLISAACLWVPAFCQNTTVEIREDVFVNQIRNSKGFCIGHFELVGFPRGQWTLGNAVSGDSGTTYDFTLQFSDSQTAVLYTYAQGAALRKRIGEQSNSDEGVRKQAIITAKVREAVIRGSLTMKDNVITAIRIPQLVRQGQSLRKGLSIVATQVTPSVRNVFGGTIEFGNSQIEIANRDDDIELTASELNGSLRLKSTDAHLAVQVGLKNDPRRQPLQFAVTSANPAEIRVALGNGVTTIENGVFRAGELSLTSDTPEPSTLRVGRIQLKYGGISAERITLTARESILTSSLEQLAFSALEGSYKGKMNVTVLRTDAATASKVGGDAEGSSAGITVDPKSLGDARLSSADIRIDTGAISLRGAGKIAVQSADESTIDGSVVYTSVSLGGLGGVSEAAVLENLKIAGHSTPTEYAGTTAGSLRTLRLGRAVMQSRSGTLSGDFGTGRDVSLRMAFDAPGSFAMTGVSGVDANFAATLRSALLQGSLSPNNDAVSFPADSIHLVIDSLHAGAGKLLGGVPIFSQEALKLKNIDSISLNQTATLGSLDFTANKFSVANPQVWTAAKDAELPLGGDLAAAGPTLLKALLGGGDVVPISGVLARDNIVLTPPQGITSVTFRISGVDVEVKSLAIRRIEIQPTFDISDFSVNAQVTATGIQITAGRISQDQNPTFIGTASEPVSAEKISGTIKLTSFPLQFTSLGIQNARITLSDVSYATPDKVQIHAAKTVLNLATLTDTDATGNLSLTDGRVHVAESATDATVGQMTLQFNGPKANPVANGNVRFNDISLSSDTRMEAVQQCTDKGDKMPVRISAQAGGLDGPISIKDGKSTFRLASNDAQFQVFKDAALWQCEWDQKVGELSVSYPCCENLCGGDIKYPCDCHICTHKIADINVRWQLTVSMFQMSGQVTQIKFKSDPGKGIKPCEGHITQLNPFPPGDPLFALNPTPPGGNIGADIVRAAIAAATAPFTTSIGNSLGNLASVASFTKIGNSFYTFGDCD
jgi:hypothetical protein